jgi:DNA polymerase-3 subunit alpha
LEALAKVGALDAFEERGKILANTETILNFSKTFQKNKNSSQVSLFGETILAPASINLAPAPPASKKEKLQWEKELLGLYVSDHPVSEFKDYLSKVAVPIHAINKDKVGQKVQLGGVISAVKKIILKNMKNMAFVTIEDMTGRIELLVFPKVLEQTGFFWTEDKVILAEGSISDKDGNFKLLVDSVKEITPAEIETFSRIEATRNKNGNGHPKNGAPKFLLKLPPSATQETMRQISQIFDQCPAGSTKVYLEINGSRLETPYCITPSEDLQKKLRTIASDSKIDIF